MVNLYFISGGQIEDDGIGNQVVYVDLGDDRPEELEKELKERIREASANGLPKSGVLALERTINENKLVFSIPLGSGRPVRVPSMRMYLDKTKNPVEAKLCRNRLEQRKFLDAYFEKLVKMGSLMVCPQAALQAAPHLVSKVSKAKFKRSINLRPANAATKAEE